MSGLVDINVLLDVLLNRRPWAGEAREIWRANHAGRFRGYVAATSKTTYSLDVPSPPASK